MAASVWRGHLTFGLVSIPVRLYPAARAKKIRLSQIYRPQPAAREEPPEEEVEPDEPVRILPHVQAAAAAEQAGSFTVAGPQARVHYTPDRPVSDRSAGIVKSFEYQKDRYVTLEKPELERLAVKTSTSMEISEFVKLDEIDPVLFETSYFVGADAGGEKPYSLLFAAMRQTGHVGIASMAMHRREHVVILRPGGKGLMLHTMFYADEVRKEQEYAAEPNLVAAKELAMAAMLVKALSSAFDAEKYKDSYREKLNALIENRLAAAEDVPGETVASARPVVDIMQALQKSLARLKKPPAAAKENRRAARRAG